MLTNEILNGTIVNSYVVCKKKGWLAARNITPTSSNANIQMGSVLGREKEKAVKFGNIEIDKISKDGHVSIREYKKTFSNLAAAKAQLLFYMLTIKNDTKCKKIDGHVVSIEESKKHWVDFNKKNEKYIRDLCEEIIEVCSHDTSPPVLNNNICAHCAHNLYCL